MAAWPGLPATSADTRDGSHVVRKVLATGRGRVAGRRMVDGGWWTAALWAERQELIVPQLMPCLISGPRPKPGHSRPGGWLAATHEIEHAVGSACETTASCLRPWKQRRRPTKVPTSQQDKCGGRTRETRKGFAECSILCALASQSTPTEWLDVRHHCSAVGLAIDPSSSARSPVAFFRSERTSVSNV